MNEIKFNCPHCAQSLAVDVAGAGATVACPQCGQTISVPQSARLESMPSRAKRGWLAGLGLAVVLLLVAAGALIWQEHGFPGATFSSLYNSQKTASDAANSAVGQEAAVADSEQAVTQADCYTAIAPLLKRSGGKLTDEVRTAYLDWAEGTVLEELRDQNQSVSGDCLASVRGDADLREAMFGAVYPPDPSIFQNYARWRQKLDAQFLAKYQSLVIAFSVAKRIGGVETNRDMDQIPETAAERHDVNGRDPRGNYQPGFWTDESLKPVETEDQKQFVSAIADFLKQNQDSALNLYQDRVLQGRLIAFLGQRKISPQLIGQVKEAPEFGEWLKNAMVLLGQRPGAREAKPDTASWLHHLTSIYEAIPSSVPKRNKKPISWPLFPIRTAPWPLLMPLTHSVPLDEAKYIWEKFQGLHGPDRFHTYGPFRNDADAMPYELQPSKWFWDAWPDRILHGGECVPISKGTVDFYSALGKPAVWAGQPGHANLISYQFADGRWSADIEQAFAGGPNVTFAQWYFEELPGTMPRFRDFYNWAGAEYHLGLALAMNHGLKSYMDTRIAAHVFRILPDSAKQNLGVKLLRNAAEINRYNPEIWYRLAKHTPDPMAAVKLLEEVKSYSAEAPAYWKVVEEFVARYSILEGEIPTHEKELFKTYTLLRKVPNIGAKDLWAYAQKSLGAAQEQLQAEATAYDQTLAASGDTFGQMRMGQRYEMGDGVPQDESKAEALFTQAAAQGDEASALALAEMNPAIPASEITVTASSVYHLPDQAPEHLINGSGMTGDVHDNNRFAYTMWHTGSHPAAKSPARGLPPSPAWVRFNFASPQRFNAIQIWNHNQAKLTDRGFRKTRIYGSAKGVNWFLLTSPSGIELPQASGSDSEVPVKIANAHWDRTLSSVIIAADATNGNYGADCFGLSAIRFVIEGIKPAIPAAVITVSASSTYSPMQSVRHLIDGSGLTGIFHDNNGSAQTMWHTGGDLKAAPPAHGLPPSPAWVRFEFAEPQHFEEILIWNHNQANFTDRGFRRTHIYGSTDGASWFPLTEAATITLPRNTGSPQGEACAIENSAAERAVKSVIIAADTVGGNYGSDCYGLSEVRFIIHR